MKKRLIFLAVFALTVLLSACSNKGGENSSHPYSWKNRADGSVRLTISNAPEEGWSWQIDSTGNGLVNVDRLDGGTGKKAVFSLTGQGFGGGSVRFVCRRDMAPFDVSFRLNMMLSASEKGKLTVISAEYTQFPAAGSVIGEENAACTWYEAEDGTRELYIDSAGDMYAWEVMEHDGTYLSLEGPDVSDTGYTYRLTGLSAGVTEFVICDPGKGYGFRLTVSVDKDLSVDVTDCEAGSVTVTADQLPGIAEVRAMVGELTIPDGISILRCSTGSWYGDGKKDCAELRLQADGKNWSLLITKSYSVEELIGFCFGTSGGTMASEVELGSLIAMICGAEEEQALFWDGGDGRCYILTPVSNGITQDKLIRIAQLWCPEQNEGE